LFKVFGNLAANILGFPYQEFRKLPPNHLRVRVGVGNKVINNHDYHLRVGREYWFEWLSQGYCHSESNVSEIGCGCGRIAQHLQGEWFKGAYHGVDIDSEQIEYCRQRFSDSRFTFALSPHKSYTYKESEGVTGIQSLGRIIGAQDSRDFIFSISLFTHLLEQEVNEYLAACYDALRPSGMIYMTFFCMEHVALGGRWTFKHKFGNAYCESSKYPEAAVAFHEDFVIELARKHGFAGILVLPRAGQSVLVAQKLSNSEEPKPG
jgi:SAM-dependent methyltransferase